MFSCTKNDDSSRSCCNAYEYILDDGENVLEVKILKIFDPIWGFDPKFFSKIHVFLVISHIEGVIGVRSLAARSVYEGYYRKT